jgi:hypothetical protein
MQFIFVFKIYFKKNLKFLFLFLYFFDIIMLKKILKIKKYYFKIKNTLKKKS